MQKNQAKQILEYLKSAYPRERWDDDRMKVYGLEIADLNYQATQTATREWVRVQPFPPTIADIRRDSIHVSQRTAIPGSPEIVDPAVAAKNFKRLSTLIRSHTIGELPESTP